MAIFSSYSLGCILFERFFLVPGSISISAIFVFLLPYVGVGSALSSFKYKKLFLDYCRNRSSLTDNTFFFNHAKKMVFISFSLQIFTWAYIFISLGEYSTFKELFSGLRMASVNMDSLVPVLLSYPNGLCFASFCLAVANCRVAINISSITYLGVSIFTIFLNDLQTSGRAGMAFVVFVLLTCSLWDWSVNSIRPYKSFSALFGISIFTQMPKVLREGYQSFDDIGALFVSVFRYCFSYLNTLSELLTRLPEPNWMAERTLLPVYNLLSRFSPLFERSAIHSIENSQVWGFNNYTISGELIRDFSYLGCFLFPFLITTVFLCFASIASKPLNIALAIFFAGWLVYGVITNVLMMGGFFVSAMFLFALILFERFSNEIVRSQR